MQGVIPCEVRKVREDPHILAAKSRKQYLRVSLLELNPSLSPSLIIFFIECMMLSLLVLVMYYAVEE